MGRNRLELAREPRRADSDLSRLGELPGGVFIRNQEAVQISDSNGEVDPLARFAGGPNCMTILSPAQVQRLTGPSLP